MLMLMTRPPSPPPSSIARVLPANDNSAHMHFLVQRSKTGEGGLIISIDKVPLPKDPSSGILVFEMTSAKPQHILEEHLCSDEGRRGGRGRRRPYHQYKRHVAVRGDLVSSARFCRQGAGCTS